MNRREIVIFHLHTHRIDIAGLQETWFSHNPDWRLPPDWIAIYSTPPSPNKTKGQGLAILVRRTFLEDHRLRLQQPISFSTRHFQGLAVSLGKVLIINIYVFCKTDGASAFAALANKIEELRGPDSTRPLLILGDFNHSSLHRTLHTTMVGRFDAHPLLDGLITRPSSQTAPDNIFGPPILHLTNPITHDVGLSDHLAVQCTASGLFTSGPGPPLPPPPPQPPPRISWWKLNIPPKRNKEAFARYETTVTELCLAVTALPPHDDLLGLLKSLTTIAANILGTDTHPRRGLEPWMKDGNVRAAYSSFERASKKHSSRHSPASLQALKRARALLQTAKFNAQKRHKLASIRRIDHGDLTPFFRALKRERAPIDPSHHPHLLVEDAVAYWEPLLSRDATQPGPPIADLPPFIATDLPTFLGDDDDDDGDDDVKEAIKATANKTPGPDGMDARLIKAALPDLLPELRRLFTLALHHGLPPELKQGRTTLIPKKDKTSTDPSTYRPITVLPVLTRMFHKAVDIALRRHVYKHNILSEHQAGFMPARSTYRQGMILSCLAAAGRTLDRDLHVSFLDVEKAFDTISHEVLLQVMRDTLHLPLGWIEVIRLLLLDNSTTILGHLIKLTRGCLQGSPLSPLLCLFLMEDLTRYVQSQGPPKDAHGHEIPFFAHHRRTSSGLLEREALWLLLRLLLFADDVATVGDLAAQQWLLEQITAWAAVRRVRFSPKSRVMALTLQGAANRDIPSYPLHLQHLTLPWCQREDGHFRYLGMPFHTNPRLPHHSRLHPIHTFTAEDRKRHNFYLACMTRLFSLPSGLQFASPRLLAITIKCVVLAKPLYPTAVTSVDYAALDSQIFPALRRLLGLPSDTSPALLWVELSLWPAFLYGELRTVRFAKEFTDSTFYKSIFKPLSTIFLQHPSGSPQRLVQTLAKYEMTLDDLGCPGLVGGEDDANTALWREHTQASVNRLGFLPHLEQHLSSMSPGKRAHFERVCLAADGSLPTGFPTYIKYGHRFALSGLHFKQYALRRLRGAPRPACLWCHEPEAECGLHLTICKALPLAAALEVQTALTLIYHQHHQMAQPADPSSVTLDAAAHAEALELLARIMWQSMDTPTVTRVLQALGRLINYYRETWQPTPGQLPLRNPIHFLTST